MAMPFSRTAELLRKSQASATAPKPSPTTVPNVAKPAPTTIKGAIKTATNPMLGGVNLGAGGLGNSGLGGTAASMNEDVLKYTTDPAYNAAHIAATKQVIANRKGMDNSAQEEYLRRLNEAATKLQPATGAGVSTPSSIADQINQARNLAVEGANQQAYDARNQADVVNMQNQQGLQERMGALGLLQSGENLTNIGQLQSARQGALTGINNQLAENIRNIDINRANQLTEQANRDRDFGLQEANLTGLYNGQQTLAGREFDLNKALQEAGLTGQYNGQRTLQGQQFDLGKQMDLANLTGMYNNNPTFAREQFNQNVKQQQADNAFRQQQFDEDVRQFGLNYALQKQAQALQAARASSSGAGGSPTATEEQFDTIYRNLKQSYSVPIDSSGRALRGGGGAQYAKTGIPNDPNVQQNLLDNIMNSSLSGSQKISMLNKFDLTETPTIKNGLAQQVISQNATRDKKYSMLKDLGFTPDEINELLG